jgi:hypothetical protein
MFGIGARNLSALTGMLSLTKASARILEEQLLVLGSFFGRLCCLTG